jgi:predicted PurR-regulated permease PerM
MSEPKALQEVIAPPDPLSATVDTTPARVSSVAFTLVAVATSIALMRYMSEVFIPFVLAGLLFYALDPLVDRLQRWRIPRAIGAAVAVVFLLGSVGAIGYSLLDDVDRIAASVPDATQRLRGTLRELRQGGPGALDRIQRAATAIAETAKEATGDPPRPDTPVKVQVTEASPNMLLTGSTQMIALGGQAIMVVFLSYFLLLAYDLFKRKLVENFGPTLAQKKVTVQILNDIAFQIERFLLVQVFTSVLVAVATTLALWSLGVQQPGVWGLAAGILNSVPYFGPVIVTLGLALVGFVQFGTIVMALTVAGVALLITTVEGWILTPTLMGRVAQMNTVAIFAGLIFWSWMWGLAGLLLAVPIMMMIKATCDRIDGLQTIGRMLGE